MKTTLFAKKPRMAQYEYYCFFCYRSPALLYLYVDVEKNIYFGLGLDQWLYCPKCKTIFKKGLHGITEQKLDNCKIEVVD